MVILSASPPLVKAAVRANIFAQSIMKKNIHPQYHDSATITCTCGQVFKVGGAVAETEVETAAIATRSTPGEKS